MSQSKEVPAPLPFELVYSDGIPLENYWHRLQMNLLIDVIYQAMVERGRTDFFVGGDMFVYYSQRQAEDVVSGKPYFRGPDVFFVGGVPGGARQAWVAWDEEGRLPDLIVELLSPSTARIDRTVKKDLYAHVFRTSEYFLYEPERKRLEGFRLSHGSYKPIRPDARGRLRSEQLGLSLGLWEGVEKDMEDTWVRLFYPDGRLAPTPTEAAQAKAREEQAKAREAQARLEAAEVELARLRAELAERGIR